DAGLIQQRRSQQLRDSYRYFRIVESNLRLIDSDRRHELPTHDSAAMRQIAHIMHLESPDLIIQQCQEHRWANRAAFHEVVDSLNDAAAKRQ
ncbi:MAG: hypothetical protein AAFP69_24065, partial [Planctomycetota bacterium]